MSWYSAKLFTCIFSFPFYRRKNSETQKSNLPRLDGYIVVQLDFTDPSNLTPEFKLSNWI